MFNGFIGTQGDKTVDAVNEFLVLINNMPVYPERIGNIKDYLNQATLTSSPTIRQKTQVVENWMRAGYNEDPRIKWAEAYNALSFDDVLGFYKQKFNNKPIAIGIIVNTKLIDKKQLESLGKVVNLTSSKIFKE